MSSRPECKDCGERSCYGKPDGSDCGKGKAVAGSGPRPAHIHKLKMWPKFYGAQMAGAKQFEVRKADRDFQLGDLLRLEEWDPETEAYTGEQLLRRISYRIDGGQFGIEQGYCVLGTEPV